jgi:hypothetical protein
VSAKGDRCEAESRAAAAADMRLAVRGGVPPRWGGDCAGHIGKAGLGGGGGATAFRQQLQSCQISN